MKLDLNGADKSKRDNFIGWIIMIATSAILMCWTKQYTLGIWLLLAFMLYAVIYLTEKVEDLLENKHD